MKLRSLSRIFFTGLVTVLPLAVTIAILWWLLSGMEQVLGGALLRLIPNSWYIPGMGILLGLLLIFAIGLLARAWLFRKIFTLWDAAFSRIPLVKTVYGAVQDFMKFVSGGAGKNFDRVVMVEIDGIRLVGFVTCEDSQELPSPLGEDDRIGVYFPMSYQIGGYTLFLPRDRVKTVDMSMETAMRFVVTAGLSGGKNNLRQESEPGDS